MSSFYLFSHFPKILFHCDVKQNKDYQPKIISSCNQVNRIVLWLTYEPYRLLIGLFFKSGPQKLTEVNFPRETDSEVETCVQEFVGQCCGPRCRGESRGNRIEKRVRWKRGAILLGAPELGRACRAVPLWGKGIGQDGFTLSSPPLWGTLFGWGQFPERIELRAGQ